MNPRQTNRRRSVQSERPDHALCALCSLRCALCAFSQAQLTLRLPSHESRVTLCSVYEDPDNTRPTPPFLLLLFYSVSIQPTCSHARCTLALSHGCAAWRARRSTMALARAHLALQLQPVQPVTLITPITPVQPCPALIVSLSRVAPTARSASSKSHRPAPAPAPAPRNLATSQYHLLAFTCFLLPLLGGAPSHAAKLAFAASASRRRLCDDLTHAA